MISKQAMFAVAFLFTVAGQSQAQSIWTGAANSVGNWSDTVAPGWTTGGVPDAIGAVATMTQNNVSTATQNIAAGVTVGTISRSGSNAASNFNIALANSITLNQDGAGSGTATLSNASTLGTSTTGLVFTGTGSLILADDLLISNTAAANTRNGGSISISSVISGAGNVTISNVVTSVALGQIRLNAANTFTGNVAVTGGGVSFNNINSLGASANTVTLGTSGGGDVNVQASAAFSTGNMSNKFVVAAGTGGTTTLGSSSTAASGNNTFSGTIALNGNLAVTGSNATGGFVSFTGILSGPGSLTKLGTGEVRLAGANTYIGNTTVNAGNGLLTLTTTGQMAFKIGANGINNQVNGTGVVTFNGAFAFDLTSASATGTWNIVDNGNLTETFSPTFSVVGFTDNGNDTWSLGNYTFSEATGVLSAVPEPSTWAMMLGGLTLLGVAVRRRRSSVRA